MQERDAMSNDGQAAITPVLLDCVDDAILVLRTNLELIYANRAALALASNDHQPIAVEQLDPLALLHPEDHHAALSAIDHCIQDGRTQRRVRLLLPDGERPVEVTLTDHRSTDGIGGIVACFRNLEHEATLEASINRQRHLDARIRTALTDQLTGLPSRRLFLDRLGVALDRAEARGQTVSVFFVDLDGFKAINDALGHSAGDVMLRSTTSNLLAAYERSQDWGRIGGDEFALFVAGHGEDDAVGLAGRIADAIRGTISLGGRPFHTSASIGIAVVQPGSADAETAVRQADIAMYEGKRRRPGSVVPFSPDMERRVVIRADLESQLRSTLIGAGPDVVFQPIFNQTTGAVFAVEALARWHSPTQGPINPDRFIRMAEAMGIIDQLDRHILRKACVGMLNVTDPASGRLVDVSVNSSTIHLVGREVASQILEVLDETGFPPERLILEVTESVAVEDNEQIRDQLRQLRERGVRIAIDDFGTGHSSLAQLEFLEIDILKIDRSFLDGVPESKRRLRYVETIVAMADALHLTVVFEGVERVEQALALTSFGVNLAQGYLFAEPCGANRLARHVERGEQVLRERVMTPSLQLEILS